MPTLARTVAPKPRPDVGFSYAAFGYSDTLNTNAYTDMKSMGVNFIRIDFFLDAIDPDGDGLSFIWTEVDRVLAGLAANNMRVLAIVNANNLALFTDAEIATLAGQIVNRPNAAMIMGMEIWNEPDLHGVTAARYATMVPTVSAAIKAQKPTMPVLAYAASVGPAGTTYFSDWLAAAGSIPNVDKYSVHPYPDNKYTDIYTGTGAWSFEGKSKSLYDHAVSVGKNRPLWVTEYGSSTTVSCAPADYWCGANATNGNVGDISESVQATRLTDGLERAMGADANEFGKFIEKFVVYQYADNGPTRSVYEQNFGLKFHNATDLSLGAQKQSYNAVKNWIAAF